MSDPSKSLIAVVGMSALLPGSASPGGFWRDILGGRDLFRDVPSTHWQIEDLYDPDPAAADKTYCKRGAFLDPVAFDPIEFGIPPSVLPATDTSQLLALVVARQVLEDATGGQLAHLDRDRVSVILGVSASQKLMGFMASRVQRPVWARVLRETGVPAAQVEAICDRIAAHYVPFQEATFPGILNNVVAGRIANRLDLGGTNCTTDAACASSLAALHMAANELHLGQSDLVITGGVDTLNDPFTYVCFSKTPALSMAGECRPFDTAADGTLLGEGIAMVALRRLRDAERDGDRIYAVLRGIGSSSDGRALSIYAPLAAGQAKAVRRAYAAAGYGPDTVELLEAHGTGTKAGDLAELTGLKEVFDATGRSERQWCALGSVKSQIGHTKGAAGAASLLKVLLSLQHKVLPPTLHVTQPNPRLDFASSAFYLNSEARPWIRDGSHPRRAALSSFGFGGSNFHATIEEYTGSGAALRLRTSPTELVLLGAENAPALAALTTATASEVTTEEPGLLASLARRSQESFQSAQPCRLAVVAANAGELRERLRAAAVALHHGGPMPVGVYYGSGPAPGRLAYLFPGQGSQYLGMGADLAMAFDEARQVWDRAASEPSLQPPIHQVVFPRPVFSEPERMHQARQLTATQQAQPALGAVSLAQLALLTAAGLRPDCTAGHSFGELTALSAAGVFGGDALLQLARHRGELMAQVATTPGAMLAVAAAPAALIPLLGNSDVVVANHNSPEQVVLAGTVPAIEEAAQRLGAAGLITRRLPVGTAFHSPLVLPACAPFRVVLDKFPFAAPQLPVYANSSAAPYPTEPGPMRALLAEQMYRPVRFADMIAAMYQDGVRTFVEVGPGATLTGLVERCLRGRSFLAVPIDRRGEHGLTSLWHALGRLAVAGVPLQLGTLWAGYAPIPDPRQRPRPPFTVTLTGSTYGMPTPPPLAALPDSPPAAVAPRNLEQSMAQDPKPPTAGPPAAERPQGPDASTALGAYQALLATMERAQNTYLSALQGTFQSLCGFLATLPVAGAPALLPPVTAPPALPPPATSPEPVRPPVTAAPVADGVTVMAPAPRRSSATRIETAAATAAAQAPAAIVPPPDPSPAAASAAMDLAGTLLQVVAEKTGYPVAMLNLDMALEADLGVDSLKRAEIMLGLRQHAPWLPDLRQADPARISELAALRSLSEIVSYLERQRDPAPTQSATSVQPADRQLVREAPYPFDGSGPRPLPGPIQVTDEGTGLATAVAARLRERGVAAEAVQSVGPAAASVVFLGGLREVKDEDEAIAINQEAFRTARALAPRAGRGTLFVTVQDTGGDFGLSGDTGRRAWLGGLSGLAKTAAREWPEATVLALDLERAGRDAASLAETLVAELLRDGPAREVGLHADGRRTTLVCAPAPAPVGAPLLADGDVLVVSGGARGITAAATLALCRAQRLRVALLGRTRLTPEPPACRGITDTAGIKRALLDLATAAGRVPSPRALGEEAAQVLAAREVRATLAAIEALGSTARYHPLDIQDPAAVAQACAAVRREFGPIRAVVHGAGVIADQLIAHKDDAQFSRVFDTKVRGLQALLQATAADPLRLLGLFSSVAARCGNRGQADYAMANEVLNKVAAAQSRLRGGSCVVRSLNFGPWAGGMVDPSLQRLFQQVGVPLLSIARGVELFQAELTTGSPAEVEVVLGGMLPPAPPPREAVVEPEELLDPAQHRWLQDHCPTYLFPVVPLTWFADRLARAAQALHPTLRVLGLRNVQVQRWVSFKHGQPVRLRAEACEVGGGAVDVTLRVFRPARSVALSRFEVAATGRVLLGPQYAPAPPAWPTLSDGTLGADPYASGVLFHGPAFQMLRRYTVSAAGSSAILDAAAGAVPLGLLHPALLDGAIHPWPHEDLSVWSKELDPELLHFASGVAAASFHGPTPTAGEVRCEVRFDGFAERPRYPAFRVQLSTDAGVWAELRLTFVYFARGFTLRYPPSRLQPFMRDRQPVPGVAISRCEPEVTRLRLLEVQQADWLPGSVACLYGLGDDLPLKELGYAVAMKDHVAARAAVHPFAVTLDTDGRGGSAGGTHYPLSCTFEGDEVVVRDAAPAAKKSRPADRAVLVTGGTGLVGSLLAAALLAEGVPRLVLPVRGPLDPERLRQKIGAELNRWGGPVEPESLARITVVPLPGSSQMTELVPLCRELGVTEIFHCAACVEYFDVAKLRAGNIELTAAMVALGRALAVERFIYVSTAYSSGFTASLIREALHPDPAADPNEYTRSKRAAEHLVAASGLPYLIVRPSVVIGDSRDGHYSGRPFGLYQMMDAMARLLTDRAYPELHLVAPPTRVNYMHQDALQHGLLAARRHLQPGAVVHLVSRDATLPTLAEVYKQGLQTLPATVLPKQLYLHRSLADIDLEAIDPRNRILLEVAAPYLDIVSREWLFSQQSLDELRAAEQVSFTDATLTTVERCIRHFVNQSRPVQDFLQRFAGATA